MGRFIDLTGKKFGRLTAIEKAYKKGNEWYWKCECECGNTVYIRGVSLREGVTRSCGCLKQESDRSPKGNVKNEIGNIYGHLTVIDRAGSDKRGEALWKCECDCGNKRDIIVLGSNLRNNHTTSCGCDRRSQGEQKIISILNENNIPFEDEKVLFKYSNGYNAKFDFYVDNKYLIEYDGNIHYIETPHGWNTIEQVHQAQERDAIKNQWCKDNNIPLIRIPYTHLNDLCIEDLKLETTKFLVN